MRKLLIILLALFLIPTVYGALNVDSFSCNSVVEIGQSFACNAIILNEDTQNSASITTADLVISGGWAEQLKRPSLMEPSCRISMILPARLSNLLMSLVTSQATHTMMLDGDYQSLMRWVIQLHTNTMGMAIWSG